MRLPTTSLQARIVALFLALIVVVQAGAYVLIETVGGAAARGVIDDELAAGARVLGGLLDDEGNRLLRAASAIAADRTLRDAATTRQRAAAGAALAAVARQPHVHVAMLVGPDDRIVAATRGGRDGERFPAPALLAHARLMQRASALAVLDGRLHQLALVPVLASGSSAWVAVAREVDDGFAQDLRGLTRLDLSILWRQGDEAWTLHASTLPAAARLPMLAEVSAAQPTAEGHEGSLLFGGDVVARAVALRTASEATAIALLQHPLGATLAPFRRLQRQLAWTSLVALALSILAGVAVARSVARPVRDLAAAARRIAAGDYSLLPPRAQPREIAELATAFRAMQQDIASRESRIMDLAYRDALTALPNRTLFRDRLAHAVAAAKAQRGGVAVLVLDLDHFKYVNDALGHPIGDLLLQEVAQRLRALAAGDGEVVARLGGDEFAMLLPGSTLADAQQRAHDVLAALERPMTPAEQVVDVRASVGLAAHPQHGDAAETLLRHADVAMYVAKRAGGGVVVFDERHDPHSRERLALMSDLRKAVDGDELALVYQPKVPLAGAGGHHVEALVRWRHPTRGVVVPAAFVPFAEQTGYIRTITQRVLALAVAQCAAWRSEGLPMHVSINLSARDVADRDLVERIGALLAEHDCLPRWIGFEITESALLDDSGHAPANLERLHALGCRIAIDDFGTGYSSLAHLRRLPLDELKIDKSFVSGMRADADDASIVRSTIGLAHDMRLAVVAEGVEDEPTLELLRALGCDMAQGYLLSAPLAPLALAAWVRESAWARAAPDGKPRRRVG